VWGGAGGYMGMKVSSKGSFHIATVPTSTQLNLQLPEKVNIIFSHELFMGCTNLNFDSSYS